MGGTAPCVAGVPGGVPLALLGRQQREDFSFFGPIGRSGISWQKYQLTRMLDFAPSAAVQQWINIALIWIGFGTLAGLLATVIFPLRGSVGPFLAMVMGIGGSTIGLLVLSWLFPSHSLNPISLVGFLAATVGALMLLALYRLTAVCFSRRQVTTGKE